MEELIERVSAILGSPVLLYKWHKSYRQISLICLAYLLILSAPVFGEKAEKYDFKPYEDSANNEINSAKINSRWNKPDNSSMKAVHEATDSMLEVDRLFKKLETSIYELSEFDALTNEDNQAILKAFAELDGLLTYIYTKLSFAREQLRGAIPSTDEEIAKCNSLKIKLITNMKLANNLRKVIADKLSNAPKGGLK